MHMKGRSLIQWILLMGLTACSVQAGEYTAEISPVTLEIKNRMVKGNSWKKGCPVGLDDLRYLRITHWDFKGGTAVGELIVHAEVAENVTRVFEELYAIGYPVKQMKLVSDFNGNDWQSIEADNTSALNCRSATGSKKWSKHAYGKAIDINPIENPYISRTGYISHKASEPYRKREHNPARGVADKAMLLKNDQATRIFEKYGWTWGGDWAPVKDYQHFAHTSE